MFSFKPATYPEPDRVVPDCEQCMLVTNRHFVNGNPIQGPFDSHLQSAVFGLGCFWGAERKFWQLEGVFSTAVGYAGGQTRNATYSDVCSGMTGHAEVALVIFDPGKISYAALLKVFWESHDPTQGMRQGNDRGTQYRSVIHACNDDQLSQARLSKTDYQAKLRSAGYGAITTEICDAPEFFYAEEYHQQFLAKNPNGYCGIRGTGVSCTV